MRVKVHMTAYGEPGYIREVVIDDRYKDLRLEDILSEIVYREQTTPPSSLDVGVGDVIELTSGQGPAYYLIRIGEFVNISEQDFREYLAIPRRDRQFTPLVLGTGGKFRR